MTSTRASHRHSEEKLRSSISYSIVKPGCRTNFRGRRKGGRRTRRCGNARAEWLVDDRNVENDIRKGSRAFVREIEFQQRGRRPLRVLDLAPGEPCGRPVEA